MHAQFLMNIIKFILLVLIFICICINEHYTRAYNICYIEEYLFKAILI